MSTSQDWSANFYMDNYSNQEISIIPLSKVKVENEVIIEVKKGRRMKKEEVESDYDNCSKTCKECGKVLASAASLYVHLKSHQVEKPYVCGECGANFTRKYYLEVHNRTHTGERPYKCDVCSKHFSQKSSLNTHRRKHTGEKPYECTICDRSFSAQSYLVSHQWTHYQKVDGVFTCNSCNLNFISRNHFAEHIRGHVNPLKYECDSCTKKFSKECHLIRHRNAVHSQNY